MLVLVLLSVAAGISVVTICRGLSPSPPTLPTSMPPLKGQHPDSVRIGDGEWHMLTLTTFPEASPGFAVFLDGVLKGLVNTFSSRSDEPNATVAQQIMVGDIKDIP